MAKMKKLTTIEEYRKRADNIRFSEESVLQCRFRHRVRDYIPGQVFYNMGSSYPKRTSFTPTEYDYNTLKEIADNGAEMFQIHSAWTDTERLLGADKFTPYDPEGVKELIKLAHELNLKIIPYFSSNFFEMRDPDFVPAMQKENDRPLREVYFNLAHCYSGSPEWLNYMLPRVEKILDDFEFDGLFNDSGCQDLFGNKVNKAHAEDMLYKLYNMVKERGKVMRIHYSGAIGIPLEERVYDYLSTGEAVKSYEGVGAYDGFYLTRSFKPYVLPMVDARQISEDDADEQFAYFIPFMQFPELKYGRPRAAGISREEFDEISKNWHLEHCTFHESAIVDYNAKHPNGPYSYTEWSAIPDNPKMKDTWFKYLALYKPMVEEGSIVHADITDSNLVKSILNERTIVSMFTNEELYLVVSNLNDKPYELVLTDSWTNRETGETKNTYTIPPKRMVFLKK